MLLSLTALENVWNKIVSPVALQDSYRENLYTCLAELAEDAGFSSMDQFMQHGKTSCLWHSIAVAYYSCLLTQLLRLRCNQRSLAMGALLHDYFLYDWHIADPSHRLHGFLHPRRALQNARQHWQLDPVADDAILRHMFPFTPIPPRYLESLVVCLVDKYCALYEVCSADPYAHLRVQFHSVLSP